MANKEDSAAKGPSQRNPSTHIKRTNNTPVALYLEGKNDWSGSVRGSYPSPINPNSGDQCDHDGSGGSDEAGFVFVGGSKFDWLVAWHVSPPKENKVYTEIAPANTTWIWTDILEKLEKSSSTSNSNWNEYVSNLTITAGTDATLDAKITKTT